MATIHYNAQAISGVINVPAGGMLGPTCGTGRLRGIAVQVVADPEQVDCKRCVSALSAMRKLAPVVPTDQPRCADCDYYIDSIGHATTCN